MIIIVAGANDHLKRSDMINAKSLFAASKYLAVTLESEFDGILAALEIAKKNNVTTIMNAAPARKDLDQGMLFHFYLVKQLKHIYEFKRKRSCIQFQSYCSLFRLD